MSEINSPAYTVISVGGMTCNHCKATVENTISAIDGIDEVSVDLQTGEVRIGGTDVNIERVSARVGELGYQYKGIVS